MGKGWCNMWAIPHTCGDPDAANGDAQPGEPCDVNSDCALGWCDIHAIPHVCGNPDESNAAGVGEACEANADCEKGWCNMWAIPHVCGDPDENASCHGVGFGCDADSYCCADWYPGMHVFC